MDIAWPVKNLEYGQLIAIPLIVAAILGSAIALHWRSTGDPVPLSMEFAGGSFIRIQNVRTPDSSKVENFQIELQKEFGGTVEIHTVENGMEVETSNDLLGPQENLMTKARIEDALRKTGIVGNPDITVEKMGSIITQIYENQAKNAAIAALVSMAIILFISLRHLTTVGGILSVVGLDFLGILGGMALLDIPLGLSSMAGILLIFGYAVNTNILLSTNVLKRKGGTPRVRAGKAMSTGIKMSSTSAAAMVALNLATSAPELEQISAVLVIGILVDMLNTWLLNSGLILRHQESEEGKYHARI